MNEDLFESLRRQLKAPEQPWGASPIGDYPELRNFFSGQSKASWSGDTAKALGGVATDYVQRQEEEEEVARRNQEIARKNQDMARQQQIAAIKAQLAEREEASWKRIPKEDGGYSFTGEGGEPTTAFQWAREKGVSLADALQGSINPKDKRMLEEHDDMENFIQLVMMSTKEKQEYNKAHKTDVNKTIEGYLQDDPELRGMKPNELMQKFVNEYPEVFGGVKMADMSKVERTEEPVQQQQQQQQEPWYQNILGKLKKNPINPTFDVGLAAMAPPIETLRQSWKRLPEDWRRKIW